MCIVRIGCWFFLSCYFLSLKIYKVFSSALKQCILKYLNLLPPTSGYIWLKDKVRNHSDFIQQQLLYLAIANFFVFRLKKWLLEWCLPVLCFNDWLLKTQWFCCLLCVDSKLVSWKAFDDLSAVNSAIPSQFSPNTKYGISVMVCGFFHLFSNLWLGQIH